MTTLKKKPKNTVIPINIWSDYVDDRSVPKKTRGKTKIFVDDPLIELNLQKEALEILLSKMLKHLDPTEVNLSLCLFDSKDDFPSFTGEHFKRWEIITHNFSHKKREFVLKLMNNYSEGNIQLNVYSES